MGNLALSLKKYREHIKFGPPLVKPGDQKYGFNLNRLKKGDILLTFGNNRKSQIIAGGTKGPFSHAMLYTGSTSYHADLQGGVYTKNPQRLIFNDRNHLIALRPANPISTIQFEKMKLCVESWLWAIYSVPQALLAPALAQSKIGYKTETQYCSRLVAQAYKAAEIQVVDNADYCSPNDIFRSSLLAPVPECVKALSQFELNFAATFDYNEAIQKATLVWLKKVRDLSKRKNLGEISRAPEVSEWLENNPEYDEVVCEYINSTSYADYVSIDRKINPWRYDSDLFIKHLKDHSISPISAILSEDKESQVECENRISAFESANKKYLRNNLKYCLLQANIQKSMLLDASKRIEVILEVKKKTGLFI